MLTIRFSRVGRKNRAQFRLVLQESSAAPTGKHVEVLGSYDPHLKTSVLKVEKIKEWIEKGAQASDSVHNLLIREGVIEGDKRKVKMPKKEATEEASTEGETKSAEEVKTEAEPVKEEKAVEEVKVEEPEKKEEAK